MSAPPQPPYSDDEDDYEDEEEEVTGSAVTSNRLRSFVVSSGFSGFSLWLDQKWLKRVIFNRCLSGLDGRRVCAHEQDGSGQGWRARLLLLCWLKNWKRKPRGKMLWTVLYLYAQKAAPEAFASHLPLSLHPHPAMKVLTRPRRLAVPLILRYAHPRAPRLPHAHPVQLPPICPVFSLEKMRCFDWTLDTTGLWENWVCLSAQPCCTCRRTESSLLSLHLVSATGYFCHHCRFNRWLKTLYSNDY